MTRARSPTRLARSPSRLDGSVALEVPEVAPWWELIARPWTSSAATSSSSSSSTERLWPRWMTSAPWAWSRRRMMVIAPL